MRKAIDRGTVLCSAPELYQSRENGKEVPFSALLQFLTDSSTKQRVQVRA